MGAPLAVAKAEPRPPPAEAEAVAYAAALPPLPLAEADAEAEPNGEPSTLEAANALLALQHRGPAAGAAMLSSGLAHDSTREGSEREHLSPGPADPHLFRLALTE